MTREAFGPNLRRLRIQRGISTEQIETSTNIARELLEGLERNEFTGWPTGIFARAYVRQYAEAIGADPDATVDEFCRQFPQGDRRAERVMREHAAIVGHELDWACDDGPARRSGDAPSRPATPGDPEDAPSLLTRLRRLMLTAR